MIITAISHGGKFKKPQIKWKIQPHLASPGQLTVLCSRAEQMFLRVRSLNVWCGIWRAVAGVTRNRCHRLRRSQSRFVIQTSLLHSIYCTLDKCTTQPAVCSIALTGMIEGKRARGRQRKTFMDWISTTCGDQWNSNEILKICHERNEHVHSADRQHQESDTALTWDR